MILINEIVAQKKYLFQTIVISVFLMIGYIFLRDNRGKVKAKLLEVIRQKWLFLFLMYSAYVLASTLIVRYRRNPYKSIFIHFWFTDSTEWNAEIIKNILFFIPYTFLFMKAFIHKRPFINSLALAFCSSATIEIFQLIFWIGEFQIADIIDNTVGGMLGYLLWKAIGTIKKKSIK